MDKIFDRILNNLVLADLWEEIIKRTLDALQGVRDDSAATPY
jgi:hypothetical protein